jgi:hypothetical protein
MLASVVNMHGRDIAPSDGGDHVASPGRIEIRDRDKGQDRRVVD